MIEDTMTGGASSVLTDAGDEEVAEEAALVGLKPNSL
jgi:hypothetical protein